MTTSQLAQLGYDDKIARLRPEAKRARRLYFWIKDCELGSVSKGEMKAKSVMPPDQIEPAIEFLHQHGLIEKKKLGRYAIRESENTNYQSIGLPNPNRNI